MRYWILGGGGSFGLHTAAYLLRQSDTDAVTSIGRSPAKPRCFSMGVGDGDPRYRYVQLHVTYDFVHLRHLLIRNTPDVIVNFAAQGESAASYDESWRFFETNCVGLSQLAEHLRKEKWPGLFVHIGSSEVYGSTDEPAMEESPLLPTSVYAISKAAFDQYLLAIHAKFKQRIIILRPSNAYGEGQQLYRFVPKAFLYGLTGRRMPLHGGGYAQKSYIHSEDLARAIYLVGKNGAPGRVYNVGPAGPVTMRDVGRMVAGALGMSANDLFEVAEDRAHQDARYWLSSDLIREDVGWQNEIGWVAGMERVHKWVKDNLDVLRRFPTEFEMRP